ncbi:MAG: hypothetical protein KAT11_05700 [Phycisphaerae bacterium]|nr:hypothetical protein [Phycisphaerae bacterium]
MDNLWAMTLLGQEEPSLWRLLAPVIVIGAIAVFRWLNEKAKQKERQQQLEDEARRQREEEGRTPRARPAQEARPRQVQPKSVPLSQAQRQRRPRAGEPIHRYQPRIPSAPGRAAEPSQAQARRPELIIEAEDLSAEAAQRQFGREQQRRLRAEAVRRARALQTQASREVRRKAKPARRRTIELKPSGELPQMAAWADTEVLRARTALLAPGQTISPPQIRRAIVWAEILGTPRALRPYEELF